MRRITKERENDKYIAAESRHFLACPTFGRVTCERLHFLVQDHRNSFDSRRQSSCKGALHGIISQVGSNVPLVVRLGNIHKQIKAQLYRLPRTKRRMEHPLFCHASSNISSAWRSIYLQRHDTACMLHCHAFETSMKHHETVVMGFSSKLRTNKSNMLHQSKKWAPLWTEHGTGWNARNAESWCPRNGTLPRATRRLGAAWTEGAQTVEENTSILKTLPQASGK